MEQKFIIQHPVTFEMYKEWAKNPITSNAIEKRKKGIRYRVIGCVTSVIMITIGALSGKLYAILMGAAFLVIFLSRLFFIPNKTIKRQYDSVIKVLNNQWIRTIIFSDKIVVEDGRNHTHFEFSEISKVTEDDKYFYLFFNADMAFRAPKDSFTLGSADDFGKFIYSSIKNKVWNIEAGEDDLGL